jgi:hypothetical protein
MNTKQLKEALTDTAGLTLHLAQQEIAVLAKRVAELEKRILLDFKGPWKAGDKYLQGDCVQMKGALWVCLCPTSTAKPGDSPAWRLAVKSGAAQ